MKTYYDILDTIIENLRNEWYTNMDNTKEKWESPQYSKSQINKADKIIADSTSSWDRDAALHKKTGDHKIICLFTIHIWLSPSNKK